MSRLKQRYTKEIAPAMGKEYGYKNVMAIPKLEKIVINIGLGRSDSELQAARQCGRRVGADRRTKTGHHASQKIDCFLQA